MGSPEGKSMGFRLSVGREVIGWPKAEREVMGRGIHESTGEG